MNVNKNEKLKIADIGCGSGAQTITLANNTEGQISLNISINESIGGDIVPQSIRKVAVCARWSSNIIEVTNNRYKTAIVLNNPDLCNSYNYNWIDVSEDCGFWCKLGISESNMTSAHCEVAQVSILPPTWLEGDVDVCWATNTDVVERLSPLNIILNYRAYDTINENDYINLTIIDADKIPQLDGFYRYEFNGKNVGASDFEYIIK